ncbi:MAG TPA: hypothetical protein ENN56_02335, partial [Firmicutes bacterium]|nr:hypothetical protein [Bacillota bacterium]
MRLLLPFKVLLTICCAVIVSTVPVRAVLLTSPDVRVDLVAETALVFWQDGIQHIVLQPVITAGDIDRQPTRVAYVVPVPSVPTSYGATDDAII